MRWLPQLGRSRQGGASGARGDIDERPASVLLISASLGAGHDGAAREFQRRLERAGHKAEIKDFLEAGPLGLGRLYRKSYEFELRHLPSAYDKTYRVWYRVPWLCPVVTWLVTLLTKRRVLKWIKAAQPDAVVSTFPLSTLCLGRLRLRKQVKVPVINFITDFSVHPLWVHPGVDLHMTVHDSSAAEASRRTGRPAVVCGPLVSDAFLQARSPRARETARASLGLGPAERAVLVVAGSWGVGDLDDTFGAVAKGERFVPVVVCGRDSEVFGRVEALALDTGGRSVVLGWTDQMPALMAGCDALVENAGGLTAFEAMRSGLPVVSYKPIAGHGLQNAERMGAAGVTIPAHNERELAESLVRVTTPGQARQNQIANGESVFVQDGAALAVRTARRRHELSPPRLSGPKRVASVTTRTAASLTAFMGLTWAALTVGVGVAAYGGFGVVHPPANAPHNVYLGVRLNAAELQDSHIVSQLKALHATAVVERVTAEAAPAQVARLASEGINVEDGGQGVYRGPGGKVVQPEIWTRAHRDVLAGKYLSHLVKRRVTLLVPVRRINAFDLIDTSDARESVVMPNTTFVASSPGVLRSPINITADRIYLADGLNSTPDELSDLLSRLSVSLQRSDLVSTPYDRLR